MKACIDAANLTVGFGQQVVLRGVNLQVAAGKVAVIVGRAGVGKSTLLRTLLGLVRPLDGGLSVCGLNPRTDGRQIRSATTYVGNPNVLEPHLTVRRNVLHILGLSGSSVPAGPDIDRALRDADVPDRYLGRPAREVSGCVALSIWLGIARLRASCLVLLDDPAAYIKASEVTHLASLLRELASGGPTVVVATSDQELADKTGDFAYLLEDGRVVMASGNRPWPVTPSALDADTY